MATHSTEAHDVQGRPDPTESQLPQAPPPVEPDADELARRQRCREVIELYGERCDRLQAIAEEATGREFRIYCHDRDKMKDESTWGKYRIDHAFTFAVPSVTATPRDHWSSHSADFVGSMVEHFRNLGRDLIAAADAIEAEQPFEPLPVLTNESLPAYPELVLDEAVTDAREEEAKAIHEATEKEVYVDVLDFWSHRTDRDAYAFDVHTGLQCEELGAVDGRRPLAPQVIELLLGHKAQVIEDVDRAVDQIRQLEV